MTPSQRVCFLAVSMLLAPLAAQANVCSLLLSANVETRIPEMLDTVNIDQLPLEEVVGEDSQLAFEAEYWVTITTGAAKWINCKDESTYRSVYHPIGLLLRPVRDIRMESRDQTIFQTEYGLNVIIDNRAVAPVSGNAGYAFADANAAYQVCKPGAVNCDGHTDLRPKGARASDWPYVSGNKGYLFSEDVAAIDAAAADWLALREELDARARLAQRSDGDELSPPVDLVASPGEDRFDVATACAKRQARLFRPFRRLDPQLPNDGAEYPTPVGYSLCTRDPVNGQFRYRHLKFVTPSIAAQKFEGLWTVAANEKFDPEVVDSLKSHFGYNSPIVTFLPCGTGRDAERKTMGELAGAPLNSGGVLNLGDELLEEIRESRTDIQMHFRSYETAVGLSEKQAIFSAPLFQDIELSVLCDGQDVVQAETLRIHASTILGQRPLEIPFHKVDADYDLLFGKYGRAPDSKRLERLSQGRLFRICDFIEYTNWRKLLRQRFLSEDRVTEAAREIGVSQDTLADHFAHLVMATFFFTDAMMITQPKEEERCAT